MAAVEAFTPDIAYRKPKIRQRIHKEPPALAVPNINDDATERRRVLNVLAQRRYRERRRREKNRGRGVIETPILATPCDARDHGSGPLGSQDDFVSKTPITANEPSLLVYMNPVPTLDAAATTLDFISDAGEGARWPGTSFDSAGVGILSGTGDSSLSALQMEVLSVEEGATTPDLFDIVDPSALLSSSSGSPSTSDNSDSTGLSFPDSYFLPVNELTVLRGLMRVAARLRCNTTTIWGLGANSPFNDGTHTALTTQELPQVWRPTLSQSSIAHHPVIDLLPWPNVRDRLIMIMNLPDAARPPAATGPLAIAQLAYDLEDPAEGVRIWGDDPCEPTSWEVGQVLFERWWFVFDRRVVDQSNYWRRLRGAATLSPKS
ncbi:putative DUF3425 domain protein [Rosellinia necatrix]|uniref:Putative DUF3425 domain protein n=1 Tax=Rosellinia necatrix TaxID=77044 RepID=A0A1W2TAY8_ROSNE|nr:putative DUF3425 domain protein [Rosellinia necatrix]